MTPKEVLQRSKNYLAQMEWIKDRFEKYDSTERTIGCCMYAAIQNANNYGKNCEDTYRVAIEVLRTVLPGGNITIFNDVIATSKEEVLAKFDEAIAKF